jgi:transcription antitermination factor NusG
MSLTSSQIAPLTDSVEWYALYTRHQHERSVAEHLYRIGFDVFLPLYHEVHQWTDRRRKIDMPLFPCYVFFSGDLNQRFSALNLPGVCSIVSSGGKVSVITDQELDAVRRALASSLSVEPHPYVQNGDRIRILGGPLAGVEGIVTRRKDALRIILSVNMLAQSVAVEIDEALVERVPVEHAL